MAADLVYQSGFGNEFATEARPGALPVGRNSPQRAPYGLYAEQLSGSAFTAKRPRNLRSWLYRIRPAVVHGAFAPLILPHFRTAPVSDAVLTPMQLRWGRLPDEDEAQDFVEGMRTMAVNGDALARKGSAVHVYQANRDMTDRWFYDADGDLLIVPQKGRLLLLTELGRLAVEPFEIAVVPRGVRFQVRLPDGAAYGYINENYGKPFEIPYLGPIGANGLANARDFEAPVAWFEERTGKFRLTAKFGGGFWEAPIDHSPCDVVAWHGNYTPYKYDLRRFNVINTVSFDHPDPSIFTVLTSPSDEEGTANVDFVIFPPRWMVATDTFRPPYFHRNVMSEYMGLIHGVYDAKPAGGFVPGGSSLHNCMSGHGPDAAAFAAASDAALKPEFMDKTMAFMFESNLIFQVTPFAMGSASRDAAYHDCWRGLTSHFRPQP